MKIEEAIQVSVEFLDIQGDDMETTDIDAIRLAVEALKRVLFYRPDLHSFAWPFLPGETNK